jgi:hypothetical protein
VSEKKKFLLRLDGELYSALEKWAADDLRSVNAQMEFLLRNALLKAGRIKETDSSKSPNS